MNKKKQLLIKVLFLSLLLIITSTTYAYWKWRSNEAEKTNVTFTTGSGFSCSADGGGNITQNDATLIPTYCTNSPYVITREITTSVLNSTSNPIYLDLWLKINSLSTELSNSNYFKYALTTSPTSCTDGTVLSTGTFNGKNNTTDNKVNILTDGQYMTGNNNGTYYLYIWLDTAETNNATQNQQFDFELEGECSTDGEYTSNSRLPSEYQQVEYIQSNGTQYIDTGFIPDQDTKVEIDFEDLGTTTVFIFGARITYASNNYGFLSIGNGFRSDYGNNVTFNYNRTVNTRYLFVKNKNVDTLYYQGNQIATNTFTYTTITPNCNMYIFTVNNNGTPGNGFNNITGANIKLYSLKIYDDGSSLVRDFIPAYRTTYHVAGLYDLVNNVFYTNANTSGDDFTVGPDV